MRFALLFFMLGFCGCRPSAPAAAPAIQKWEYKVMEIDNSIHGYVDRSKAEIGSPEWVKAYQLENSIPGSFDIDLNAIGRDGWELVSSVPQIESNPDAEVLDRHDYDPTTDKLKPIYKTFINQRTAKVILIFKRPAR